MMEGEILVLRYSKRKRSDEVRLETGGRSEEEKALGHEERFSLEGFRAFSYGGRAQTPLCPAAALFMSAGTS